MIKKYFFLIIVFLFFCFANFAAESEYVFKIIHKDLVLDQILVLKPELAKEMNNVLKNLLISLRSDEEYSKNAVSNAVNFISKNKQAKQSLFVKFCLGYYLSEISVYCAGRRDLFVEMVDDSSKILNSIVEENKSSWEAKFARLVLPKETQILIRDMDPDYRQNPNVVEILVAFDRANLQKYKDLDLVEKDELFEYFQKSWLQMPYTEECSRYSTISSLLYLGKKEEATKEFNNFKADFPDSNYIKDLEKKFSEYSKPPKEEKSMFDCD